MIRGRSVCNVVVKPKWTLFALRYILTPLLFICIIFLINIEGLNLSPFTFTSLVYSWSFLPVLSPQVFIHHSMGWVALFIMWPSSQCLPSFVFTVFHLAPAGFSSQYFLTKITVKISLWVSQATSEYFFKEFFPMKMFSWIYQV